MGRRAKFENSKFHLLHVRLDAEQFQEIEKIVAARPSANLSDVVREALTVFAETQDQRAKFVVLSD
ncbi:MAG: hypothetical protein ACAI35_14795, partial [Candidatus Methylacidiphilales bacterium]